MRIGVILVPMLAFNSLPTELWSELMYNLIEIALLKKLQNFKKRDENFHSHGRSQPSYFCSLLVCLPADQSDEGQWWKSWSINLLFETLFDSLVFAGLCDLLVLLNWRSGFTECDKKARSHFTWSPFCSWHSSTETVMTMATVNIMEAIPFHTCLSLSWPVMLLLNCSNSPLRI